MQKRKLTIHSNRILLVEGRDEAYLFKALIRRCLDGKRDIQVIEAGGINRFPANLQAIGTAARSGPTLRSLGVVRDADDDPEAAFRSIRDHLRNAGYESPATHGRFSDASPTVGVFVVPDGRECGAMETLCRRSVEGSDAARCVERYLQCLEENNAMGSTNRDKSFAHAYLAAMRNPVARVGEGAHGGVWNFDSPAFREILCFIRNL